MICMVLGDIYYRILSESGIRFSRGTYITMPSLLEQLAALGDPRVAAHTQKPAQQRNLQRIFESTYRSRSKVDRIDDSVFERRKGIKWTTNEWYAIVPNHHFHTFSFGEAFTKAFRERSSASEKRDETHEDIHSPIEWSEFAIPELVSWQESHSAASECDPLETNHECDWIPSPISYDKVAQHAVRISLRTMFERLQEAGRRFLQIPERTRTEFFASLRDTNTRIALHHLVFDIPLRDIDIEYVQIARAYAFQIKTKLDQTFGERDYTIAKPLFEAFCDWGRPQHYIPYIPAQLRSLVSFDSAQIPEKFEDASLDPTVVQRHIQDLHLRVPRVR